MNKAFKFAAVALCSLFALASCDKKNQENPDGDKLVIPEILLEGYYYGDVNESGTGNILMNLICGGIDMYEDENFDIAYKGDGFVLCLDVNTVLAQSAEEADHFKLVPGVYTVGDDTFSEGTWNAGEDMSYYIEVRDDKLIHDGYLVDGELAITEVKGGYKISFTGVLDDEAGSEISVSTVSEGRLVGRTEDALCSNLDKNLKVTSLVQGNYGRFEDMTSDGTVDTFALALADEHYDLDSEYGKGESFFIYINVEAGTEKLETGHYDVWANPLDETEIVAGTLMSGITMWGMYMGTWYFCPARGYEASFVDGYVDVEELGDGNYSVSGELVDAYGKTVSFTFEGELPEVVYETEEYSVKSQVKVPNCFLSNFSTLLQRK